MSAKAKGMRVLYRMKKVTIEGLRKSVSDGIITAEEYKLICGEDFPAAE